MPEIAGRDDADEFTIDLLIGENGNFRKARHSLLLVKQHLEGPEPPAESKLMLRFDMLIAENHDLLVHEDIDNITEEFFIQLFGQVYAGNGDTELVRQSLRVQR